MFGTQVGQEPGDLSVPAARWHAQGQPRPARVPVARPGARGSGPGSAGERGSCSERAADPPRTALSDPGCVLAPGPQQSAGEGAGTPLPAPPQRRPRPHAPYSAWLPRSAPCAALPAPASAPAQVPALAPLPLRFPLGCRCVRARAPASRGARRSASACSARRGVAGRGPAEPTRGPRSPAEAVAAASRLPGFPALPQPRPAARRPSTAAHATAARSRHPAPRLRGLSSAGPPPGSFLSWGDAAEGEGRAAPLCALPARHPHSGRRGGAAEEAERCREAGVPARRVRTDGQACVESDIQIGGSRGAD